MPKKEVNTNKIINILIIIVLVSFAAYSAHNFYKSRIPETEIPRDAEYDVALDEEVEAETQSINLSEEEDLESLGWEGGGGGGGAGGGAGTESGETTTPETPEEGGEEETPSAQLSILDYEYEIIDFNTAKINSLTYQVENQNVGVSLELLVYIYDENDDQTKKGLVRDQISVGQLSYGEVKTDTVSVNAYYNGNLAIEKTLKITLIGYIGSSSYNLGSVTENILLT